jgi:hypothetical protein
VLSDRSDDAAVEGVALCATSTEDHADRDHRRRLPIRLR